MPRAVPVAVAAMPPVPSHAPPAAALRSPSPVTVRTPSPARAARSAVAPVSLPVSDGLESWRSQLARGDTLEIRSVSAGLWVTGRIMKMDRDRLKVEYIVGKELCDKVVLLSSPDIRPARRQAGNGSQPPASPACSVPSTPVVLRQANTPAATPATPPRPLVASPAAGTSTPATPAQVARTASGARLPSRQSSLGPARRRWVEVQVASPSPQTPQPKQCSSPSSASSQCLRFASSEWLKLGELQMEELLGSGGFGAVHRGRLHGEEVAIKRLHLSDGQVSKEHLAEFQKEVANLQQLRHPRLIRFIGVALELPVMCIVTELAEKGSLYALLHVQKMPLSESHRRALVLEICEGVAFLHGRKPPCVHRDLKSANVVLDRELHAKLCDFGLAETMEKTHISRRESEAGSPRYMAPEVFDARSKLTEKLDVWALGCLVVEVLIDQVPHEDCSSIQQVAAKLLVRNLAPFEDDWADGLRGEVRTLVGACFAKEAAGRPTAQALWEGLRRLESLALPRTGIEAVATTAVGPPSMGTVTVPPTTLLHCVH